MVRYSGLLKFWDRTALSLFRQAIWQSACIKGTVSQDFLPLVFFIKQLPLGP
jgi:hypothetical protein